MSLFQIDPSLTGRHEQVARLCVKRIQIQVQRTEQSQGEKRKKMTQRILLLQTL